MYARLLASLCAVFLAGCGDKRETVSGKGRIHSVEYQKHWITLVMQQGVRPEEVVAISLFHGLQPNTTHATANTLLGMPHNVRRKGYNIYNEYFFRDGRVEVGREEYSSGGKVGIEWSLTAYPANLSYVDVLTPDVARTFELRSQNAVIQLLDSDRKMSFLIILSGTRVEKIGWLPR